jgi:O-antigen/teichoic acid export membrane protein
VPSERTIEPTHLTIDARPLPRSSPFARVLSGFAALAAGEVVDKLIAAAVSIYLARVLTAAGFGLVGYATALATYFVLGVDLGLDFLATREVARQPAAAGSYARRLIALRLAAATVVTACYLGVALVLPLEPAARVTVALYGLLFFPYALTPKGVLLGLERRRPWALAQVVGQLVFGAGCVAIVSSPAESWRVPVVQALADTAQAAVALLALRSLLRAPGALGWPLLATLRQALPFAWAQGMRLLHYNFDVLLIYSLFGDAANGAYLAAYKVVLFFIGFGALYGLTLLPAIARYYPRELAALPHFVGSSLGLTSAVVLPIVVGGVILAEQGVELVYGPGYQAAVLPLRILLLTVALTVLGSAFRNVLIGCDRQRQDLALVTAAAVLNVLLNLLITPRFGLAGAAVVTVCSDTVVLLGSWVLARRLLGPVPLVRPLAPALVATGVMAILLLVLLAWLPWPAAMVLAGLGYGGIFVRLGGLSQLREALHAR